MNLKFWKRGPSDEEQMADALMGNPDALPANALSPNVVVHEVKGMPHVIPTTTGGIIGIPVPGHVPPPILLSPSIAPVRWFQFWRWHLAGRYRRELEESRRKYREFMGPSIVGPPTDHPVAKDIKEAYRQGFGRPFSVTVLPVADDDDDDEGEEE